MTSRVGAGDRSRLEMRSLAVAVMLLAVFAAAAPAHRLPKAYPPVSGNPADRLADRPIDDYRYDNAHGCRRSPTPGALALQSWLGAHAAGVSWGIMRCEKLGPRNYSLHAEGRAIDWHIDARAPAGRRAGVKLLRLLLADDRAGNPNALARRMGIQEIIWDCQAWWAGSQGFEPYSACYGKNGRPRRHVDATTAHRDHIHIGLNWPGARRQSSFWAARL